MARAMKRARTTQSAPTSISHCGSLPARSNRPLNVTGTGSGDRDPGGAGAIGALGGVSGFGPAPLAGRFTLYPLRPGWYVNFGFWDVKRTREAHPRGHFNRMIEEKVGALGGIKSLYSESFFPEDEFRRIYGGDAYAALKRKYDPQGAFPGLYEKCVLRH